MKQIKDLLVERLILNKHATKQEYFFHKEVGVLFKNGTRMRLYSISTSEDRENRDSILGFIIKSPYDLDYTDTLGREAKYKSVGAIKYADVENNIDQIITTQFVEQGFEKSEDECFINYPGEVCDSLSMQLPKIIAIQLVALLSELYNNKFFENGGFQHRFLHKDWYIKQQ